MLSLFRPSSEVVKEGRILLILINSAPTVILLHGFPGNADSPYGLAERLNKNGMNILVFNYEGSFKSEGVFSWENCMTDVGAAISYLKQKDNIKQFSLDTSFRTALEKRIAASALNNGPIRGDSAYIHNYFGQIMANYEYFDLIKNADKLKNKEILFITGWLDTTVPMEEFIIPTYRHFKNMYPEFVSIKAFETDHFFADIRDDLANSITEWVKSK